MEQFCQNRVLVCLLGRLVCSASCGDVHALVVVVMVALYQAWQMSECRGHEGSCHNGSLFNMNVTLMQMKLDEGTPSLQKKYWYYRSVL